MIVTGYHGLTRGDIDGELRMPLYLAYQRDLAEAYSADSDGGTMVLTVEAVIANPLVLDVPFRLREVLEASGALDPGLPNWHPAATGRVCDWAQTKGFDAILIPDEAGFDSPSDAHWEMARGTYGEPQMILLSPSRVTVTAIDQTAVVA